MKRFLPLLFLTFIAVSFVGEHNYRVVENNAFKTGEFLKYRIHYGFVTAGEATMEVLPDIYTVNDRPCFRIDTKGTTSGSFKLVTDVDNLWRTYIDTSALVSQKFCRYINENKYNKIELSYYDHSTNQVRVIDERRKIDKTYSVPANAQDMISGAYYLRSIDFSKLNKNDTIVIPGFVEDTAYELKLVYRGKGTVKNKFGKFKVLKLNPIMPKNSFFDGENSLRIWLSDDENKIPIKIEANMFIGAIEIDLEEYSGLKHKLNKVK